MTGMCFYALALSREPPERLHEYAAALDRGDTRVAFRLLDRVAQEARPVLKPGYEATLEKTRAYRDAVRSTPERALVPAYCDAPTADALRGIAVRALIGESDAPRESVAAALEGFAVGYDAIARARAAVGMALRAQSDPDYADDLRECVARSPEEHQRPLADLLARVRA